METYNIRLRKNFINFSPFEVLSSRLIAFIYVICQYIHAKRMGKIGDRLSNPSKSDYTHGFAIKFNQRIIPEAKVPAVRPCTVTHRVTMPLNMLCHLKYKRKCHLRDRFCTICRYIRYDNISSFSSFNINNIISGCKNPYIFQAFQLRKLFLAERSFIGKHYFCALCSFDCLIKRCMVIYNSFAMLFYPVPA